MSLTKDPSIIVMPDPKDAELAKLRTQLLAHLRTLQGTAEFFFTDINSGVATGTNVNVAELIEMLTEEDEL